MKNTIIVFFVLGIFLFGTDEVFSQCACVKNYPSVYDEFKASDAMFIGSVIEIKKGNAIEKSEYFDFEVKFKVETAWKTDLTETITIKNVGTDSSDFRVGESYLVYAKIRNNELRANLGCCDRTKRLSQAKDNLRVFKKEGEKPRKIIKETKSK